MDEFNATEWGQHKSDVAHMSEDLSELRAQVKILQVQVSDLAGNLNRGIGIFTGIVLILGVFSGEIVQWVKSLMRM